MKTTEYGLIGKKIGHSYSAKYFNQKFQRENIAARYDLYPLESIESFPELIENHPQLAGLNVTIPYKVEIIPYLNELSEEAQEIGAVNVIKISHSDGQKKLKGYNTDAYGFTESLKQVLKQANIHTNQEKETETALVLGTGGASKAIAWSLRKTGFKPQLVGRKSKENCIAYGDLTAETIEKARIVVNCTPLGTSPDIDKAAPFPYEYLHPGQVCYDLVYNPAETLFMRICKAQGCTVSNGLEMLRLQAVGAWNIWNQ